MPKSVFVELANKTNMYSLFKEGKSAQTNEEIRSLISVHLLMGVVKYLHPHLYWKPVLRTEMFANVEMSWNCFEKHCNCLHIDFNHKNDESDRLWKLRPLVSSFQKKMPRYSAEGTVMH